MRLGFFVERNLLQCGDLFRSATADNLIKSLALCFVENRLFEAYQHEIAQFKGVSRFLIQWCYVYVIQVFSMLYCFLCSKNAVKTNSPVYYISLSFVLVVELSFSSFRCIYYISNCLLCSAKTGIISPLLFVIF